MEQLIQCELIVFIEREPSGNIHDDLFPIRLDHEMGGLFFFLAKCIAKSITLFLMYVEGQFNIFLCRMKYDKMLNVLFKKKNNGK